ncbi:hypothetical protein PsorP6_018044 [Peronosclerospora sorghi]|uniref:Uncharacterized protein n=1 Tax=Peronosclerospora sorghi TaxID=230839 RepID=A0ACC0WEN8_9STRA|nr:hypothetical protein PsorP6_018044 [Peronosclerospora sorghi]
MGGIAPLTSVYIGELLEPYGDFYKNFKDFIRTFLGRKGFSEEKIKERKEEKTKKRKRPMTKAEKFSFKKDPRLDWLLHHAFEKELKQHLDSKKDKVWLSMGYYLALLELEGSPREVASMIYRMKSMYKDEYRKGLVEKMEAGQFLFWSQLVETRDEAKSWVMEARQHDPWRKKVLDQYQSYLESSKKLEFPKPLGET